ncbi:YqaE/Pmp3 family membrane protein [Halobacillus litoralis]|uniref:YqaE/Pmp3 family membrane protein n=1 Tax=Halobacillus litoralis TaxID=45668 RepID=UPI001CD54107|nr:YqaE/Pmp3 family membrane protein [Halobacillus litoralis]MCA0971849.1 YqaE/Pmp3 family membrane protein [Halobacillus litoralis]
MLYILVIFLPPLAVLFTGRPFTALLNLLLTLLFYVPGAVHAAVVVKGHYDAKKRGA